MHHKDDIARTLLAAGANVDSQIDHGPDYGCTALHLAIKSNACDLVMQLLQRGASLTTTSLNGDTPISLAVKEKKWPLVNIIIAHQGNIPPQAKAYYVTVLQKAIENKQPETVQLLLAAGIKVNTMLDAVYTSLAIAENDADIVTLLREYGVPLDDDALKNALEMAVVVNDNSGTKSDASTKSKLYAKYKILHELRCTIMELHNNNYGATFFKPAPNTLKLLHAQLSKLPTEDRINNEAILIKTLFLRCREILIQDCKIPGGRISLIVI